MTNLIICLIKIMNRKIFKMLELIHNKVILEIILINLIIQKLKFFIIIKKANLMQ